jgi:nitroreductase
VRHIIAINLGPWVSDNIIFKREGIKMELSEVIKMRRSIRKFKDISVPRELIEEIIELALWAPSNYNMQGWYFVVVQGKKKDQIVAAMARKAELWATNVKKLFPEKMVKIIQEFFATMGGAPVLIFVYTDKTEEQLDYMPLDIEPGYPSACAAIQNLLLAAHDKGLGACWVAACCIIQDEIDEILGIREVKNKIMVAGIPIGYPDQSPPAPPRVGNKVQWIGF